MGRIATYADLKSSVLGRLERSQDARAIALVPEWVAQAEEDIEARLRAPWLAQASTTTLDEEWEELPPGHIRIGNVLAKYGSTWWPLTSASLGQIAPYLGQPDFPRYYCIENFSITVAPGQRPVDLRYTFWLTEERLESDGQSNATLTRASGVYLYGALRHACVHYGDDEGLARYDAAFERALAQANDLTLEWIGGDGITSTMQSRRRRVRIGVIDEG